MPPEASQNLSDLISAWGEGNEEALNRLMPLVYPELRKIARRFLRRPSAQTLESAALANEAYLRLVRAGISSRGGIRCESRVHFLALCSQIIRRIVVDHARSRGYAKRGGGGERVSLDGVAAAHAGRFELFAMDEALKALSKFDPRKARVVELRYFGGLTFEETAEALAISPETAKRDWKVAKAWLFRELRAERE